MRLPLVFLSGINCLVVLVFWARMAQNTTNQTFETRLDSVLTSTPPILTIMGTERFPSDTPDSLLQPGSLFPDWSNVNISLLNAMSLAETQLTQAKCNDKKTASIYKKLRGSEGANQGSLKHLEWLDYRCGKISKLPASFFSSAPFIHPLGGSYLFRYYLLTRNEESNKFDDFLKTANSGLILFMHVNELAEFFRLKRLSDLDGLLKSEKMDPFSRDNDGLIAKIRERLILSMLTSKAMEAFLQGMPYYRDTYLTYYKRKLGDTVNKEHQLFFATDSWIKSWSSWDAKISYKNQSDGVACKAVLYDDCFVYGDEVHVGFFFHFLFFLATCLVTTLFLNRLVMYRRESSFLQDRQDALAILAHELRTPLASLALLTNNLREEFDRLSEKGQKSAMGLFDEINRLNRTANHVDQFLIPKIDRLSSEKANLATIESLVDSFKYIVEKFPNGVLFEYKGQDRPSGASLLDLEIVIGLLVRNALAHGRPPVTVRLEIELSAFTTYITDEGELKKDELASIMKPFYRRSGSSGLGLGLSLVQSLLKKAKSTLRVKTNPTVFFFKIKG